MNKEYKVGQEFICIKDTSFHNTEEELIDISKNDTFLVNDIMEDCNGILHYFIIFGLSNIEARLTKEEIDEIITGYKK